MKLEEAKRLAERFVSEIAPFCETIRIVGSIRRRKNEIRDIDLVLIVSDGLGFTTKLRQVSSKFLIAGSQQKRVIYEGEQFDIYIASPETYEPLVLIRTGSAAHNIKLSMLARKKGMKLTHKGLVKDGKVFASTEKEIFEALDLPYAEPNERE